MKLSELMENPILLYSYIDVEPEYLQRPDRELIEKVYLPAAVSLVCDETGMKKEELDRHDDLTVAVMAAVRDMYDNRGMTMAGKQDNSKVVESISGHHRYNLV